MKNDPSLSALFKSKLDSRTADLAAGLLKDIHAPSLNKAVAVRIASWLQRLDETDKAREAFLNGRAALVKRRVRQIKFEGDIEAYIGELAIVVFTLVKNTCEWYMAAFRDSKLASGASKFLRIHSFRSSLHRLRPMGDAASRAFLCHVSPASARRRSRAQSHGKLPGRDQDTRYGRKSKFICGSCS